MKIFIGIDISAKRDCAIARIDESGHALGAWWICSRVDDVVQSVMALGHDAQEIVIGIDSPRVPVNDPRDWYWNRNSANWRLRLPGERGWGRHCEVVLSALKLANPQWTPPESEAPAWMRLGFQLFTALQSLAHVLEVFPTASYEQLANARVPRLVLPLAAFAAGPKDMLDAYVAALTVREFMNGEGCSVGGGDGLGAIALPKRLGAGTAPRLLQWPSSHLQHL